MTPPLSGLILALALSTTGQAQPPTFEVVSIKPNNSGSGRSSESTNPGRLTAINITADWLIQQAFGIKAFQISGSPGWLATDSYDVIATTGTTKDLNDKELRPYFQAMLADRFHLKYHRETKEGQIYSLTVAKTGSKMTAHVGEGDNSNNISNRSDKVTINSSNISMANLASLLGGWVDRIVVDNTGLPHGYDLKLEWAPNPTAESAEPSLFVALQEQLGLKLESTKGPVDFIIIDNLEKPSEN